MRRHFGFAAFSLALCALALAEKKTMEPSLYLVTVATEETDGLKRLRESAAEFGHVLHVFGLGQKWNGGDMTSVGGGQKIRILRENLKSFRDREDVVILFTDAYDVILNADEPTILRRFFSEFADYRVVFSAEPFCWPDRTLAPKYPP
ncbi:hypothetical protein AAVH_39939, partial [Aphelenchoides avenae]